ncbi:uncharacterized protein EV154DRAFT_605347 [Mucor mucedo]|uniref:uncharacterized protein n=1 Tax=Mucor mucedo TaxID=29922 RepID=UPI002220C71A|nr:uncharacterized protein EV154DRAFT_605347 [Mucor mucedo]KAI7887766.1 hypothetical protein EV154DRAFT_605347 [Mucor mucedo]
MSNWALLPTEILAEVIDYALSESKTKKAFQKHCMLICKDWSIVSRTALYNHVTLHKEAQFEPFLASLTGSINGQLVKELELHYNEENLESALGRLLKSCPNLSLLLVQKAMKSSFFEKLLLEIAAGNGTKLRSIPFYDPRDLDTIDVYGNATYALKDRLEHLRIWDYKLNKTAFYQNETLNRLGMYRNLQSIIFQLQDHSNIFKVFEMIQYCPTLTSVKIVAITADFKTGKDVDIAEPFNLQPLVNVQELEISETITITARIIQYILLLFPNLTTFLYGQSYTSWRSLQQNSASVLSSFKAQGLGIPTELWVQFFKFMHKIDICQVSVLFIKDYVELFSKVPYVCENLDIIYADFYGEDVELEPYFNIFYNDNSDMHIRNMYQEGELARRIVFKNVGREYYAAWPHDGVLQTLGHNIKALNVRVGTPAEIGVRGTGVESMVEENLFNLICDNCQTLDTLWVSRGTFNNPIQDSTRSLQHLELIQFDYCNFDQYFLSSLSTHLPPKLKFVIFLRCTVIAPMNSAEFFTTIDMPNTLFDYLLWKSPDADEPVEETVYLKITKREATSYYYKISIDNQLAMSSFEDFEASKNNPSVETVDIRCLDIEKLIFKRSEVHFILFPKKEPVIGDEYEFMALREFHNFYDNY